MILIHIDMIAMHVYICCRYKPRNDALIHSTIQWKSNENARGGGGNASKKDCGRLYQKIHPI